MFLSVHDNQVHWSGDFRDSQAPLWLGLAVPQAWSLGIELSFYLIAPYLLNFRSRWLIVGSCCSLGLKLIVLRSMHLVDPWTYRFFPFEVGCFLAGALAFRHRHLLDDFVPERIGKYVVYPLVIAFAAFRAPVSLPYPLLLACILPFLFRMTSELKFDRLIGELSYPFYIFHYFAIEHAGFLTHHWLRASENSIAWVALGLTLVFAITGLTLERKFIEPWRVRLAERHSELQARFSHSV